MPPGSAAQHTAVRGALQRAFSDTDGSTPDELATEGGSTAVVALVSTDAVHVAHAGNYQPTTVTCMRLVVPQLGYAARAPYLKSMCTFHLLH